ncbi:hypothetical protein SAE02_61660 [Skermanella aerolata]|uniref:Uncharacterized protein n=1 Tax=Skermanella aerolata TaxID=393310 RepID=A0A512DZV2_9PROT|nr:hypothetical protein [Skermanella aerolata]KJB91875.1 hypothetical protein N826_25500 [Skermanella aerolata KACC 11604]GEO42018.1 hypothetical protein SAE02_61660 [Skermanella aerolata]
MRLYFPNTALPKKSAKSFHDISGSSLSASQAIVAKLCGYASWHDLEKCHAERAPSPLNRDLPSEQAAERRSILAKRLAVLAGVSEGRAADMLAVMRLTGSPPAKPVSDRMDVGSPAKPLSETMMADLYPYMDQAMIGTPGSQVRERIDP